MILCIYFNAVLGTDYRLGDTSGLYTTNSATVLVFRRGSSIDRRQCLLVDTFTAPQCREYVHFNMTLSSTTPPVGLQEPLTASVSFTDSNTSCLCPKISIEECGTDTGVEVYNAYIFTLLSSNYNRMQASTTGCGSSDCTQSIGSLSSSCSLLLLLPASQATLPQRLL